MSGSNNSNCRLSAFSLLLPFLLACTLPACVVYGNTPLADTPIVSISLYPDASVESNTISIGDVAKVYCKDKNLAKEVEQIDLDEFGTDSLPVKISRKQIRIRLYLHGLDNEQVKFFGAASAVASHRARITTSPQSLNPETSSPNDYATGRKGDADAHSTNNTIVDAIQMALAEYYGLPRDQVLVVLKTTPTFNSITGGPKDTDRLKILTDPSRMLGNCSTTLAVVESGRVIDQTTVKIETSVEKLVAVAKRGILRGEILSRDNVNLRKRRFQDDQLNQSMGDEIFGRFAARSINTNSEFRISDIQLQNNAAPTKPVIKMNDRVTVLHRNNRLNIQLHGAVALQSGKVGEIIRLRNEDSKRVLTGEIISASEVRLVR